MSEVKICWPSGRRETLYLPSTFEEDETGEITLARRGVEGVSGAGSGGAATETQTTSFPSGRRTPPRHASDRAEETPGTVFQDIRRNINFHREVGHMNLWDADPYNSFVSGHDDRAASGLLPGGSRAPAGHAPGGEDRAATGLLPGFGRARTGQ